MSRAQTVQVLVTLAGIALGVLAFLFAPFGMMVNGILALVIFIAAGAAASLVYAKLAARPED